MAKIARPLPAPPEGEVITPQLPIPVMMTMVDGDAAWDLPAVAEAWTASQLVRIHWVHPRTGEEYTHWVPSSAIRRTVERRVDGQRRQVRAVDVPDEDSHAHAAATTSAVTPVRHIIQSSTVPPQSCVGASTVARPSAALSM